MDELGIAKDPKRDVELNQFVFAERLLLLFLIHNQALFDQDTSDQLNEVLLATGTSQSHSRFTYIVYRAPVFLLNKTAGNSRKSNKETFGRVLSVWTVIRTSSILPRLMAT